MEDRRTREYEISEMEVALKQDTGLQGIQE